MENKVTIGSEKALDDSHVLATGKKFINQLCLIFKTASFHAPTNVALMPPLEALKDTIETCLVEFYECSLEIKRGFIYLNKVRIRYDSEGLLSFSYIIQEFEKRFIKGITFQEKLSIEELKVFAYIFIGINTKGEEPYKEFVKMLKDKGLTKILVEENVETIAEEETIDEIKEKRKYVKQTYFRAVSLTKNLMNDVKSGKDVNIRKAKRVVESIVDIILEEQHSLIGLTTIKDYDEYTFNHCVNVSIFAISVGQRLGLEKYHLSQLGLCGIFHDLGKVNVPHEVLNKPAKLDENDWKVMKRHPYRGALLVLKVMGITELGVRAMLSAFEHHLNKDLSGYPHIEGYGEIDIFSKIISIVDRYDALTSSRVYNRIPYSMDKALSILMETSGTKIDSVVFKVFVNLVGIYPIGTLLLLDSKELALVFQANPNPEYIDRPKVLIITDPSGNRIMSKTYDLSDTDPSNGRFRKSIKKVLDYKEFGINLAEYYL